jgi:hypothetical protein
MSDRMSTASGDPVPSGLKVSQRPPKHLPGAAERAGRIERDVEVRQQRPAVLIEEDVRRFDVAVEDAPVMRVRQRLGQASADPAHRLDEVARIQELALAQRRGIKRRRVLAQAVDTLDDGPAAPFDRQPSGQGLNETLERRPRHVLHAQKSKVPLPVHDFREDVDDVVVLQACQGPRLRAPVRRNLERHLALERDLPGQVHPGK